MSTKERPFTTPNTSNSASSQETTRKYPEQPQSHGTNTNANTGTGTSPKTRITIHYDVGFSNAIYIRGQGAGLSWEKGRMLKNIKPNEWAWETTEPFTSCEFKVLVNDQCYEQGNNHVLTCGASIRYTPHF